MKRLLLFVLALVFTFNITIAAAQNSLTVPAEAPAKASTKASHAAKIKKSVKKTNVAKVKKHKIHHKTHKTEIKGTLAAQPEALAEDPAFTKAAADTPGAQNQCSETRVIAAVKESSALKSWQNIYDSYRKYQQCDDGAIAEGYSDLITGLMANNWDTLKDLKMFTETDKEFLKFVLRHIDASVDPEDVKKVSDNASQHCAADFSELCSLIKERAEEILKELNN
jgi:hypothetical protein